MENLVFKGANSQALTNSLLVAQKFGKRHGDILRSVDSLISTDAKLRSFFQTTTYRDSKGEARPMFIMNRDGFSLLVMGFTGDKALKFKLDFIDAFNKMEEAIKTGGFQIPSTLSGALRLAAEQAETIEAQQKQLGKQAKMIEARDEQRKKDFPRLTYAYAVETSSSAIPVGELAKIIRQNGINIGQNRLFAWMRDKGYLGRRGVFYNIPTQKSMNLGLYKITPKVVIIGGREEIKTEVKVTGKGQIYFVNRFLYDALNENAKGGTL